MTTELNALQTILEQAEALRNQMATELHAEDPERVTINEWVDHYRTLANEANQLAQNQGIELAKRHIATLIYRLTNRIEQGIPDSKTGEEMVAVQNEPWMAQDIFTRRIALPEAQTAAYMS